MSTRRYTFQEKRKPIISLSGSFSRTSGIPADGTFKRSGRTDVFAEARHHMKYGYQDHKEQKDHIFQPGQRPGHFVLPEFRSRDLVKQVLQKPEGTEEPANEASQKKPHQDQSPQNIIREFVLGRHQGTLKASQRAGSNSAGA